MLWRGRSASVKMRTHATVFAWARFDGSLAKRNSAPVAQMDRATASEAVGREFDPHRARHFYINKDLLAESSASR